MKWTDDKRTQVTSLLEDFYEASKDSKSEALSQAKVSADYYFRKLPKAPSQGVRYIHPVVEEKVEDYHRQLSDILKNLKDNITPETCNVNAPLPPQAVSAIVTTIDNALFHGDSEQIFDSIIRDSLICGTSGARWYVDDMYDSSIEYFTELSEEEFNVLKFQHKDTGTVTSTEEHNTEYGKLYSGQVVSNPVLTKKVKYKHVMFNNFQVDPSALTIDEANYACITSYSTKYDLIESGISKKIVDELTNEDDFSSQADVNSIQSTMIYPWGNVENDYIHDKGLSVVKVKEHFIKTDLLDGQRKLWKITMVGNTILDAVEEDSIPLAVFRPIPNISSFWGVSLAWKLKSQQDAATCFKRGIMDNIYNANMGRVTAVKGAYNKRDLMDNRSNGIVEIDMVGAIQPLPYNPLPAGIDMLIAQVDADADNVSGISNETTGRGESAFSSGVTATQLSLAHTKADLAIKAVAKGIISGLKALCKGLYGEYRKKEPNLPQLSAFTISIETESSRASQSAKLLAGFQAMSQAGWMTPKLGAAMAGDYLKSLGLGAYQSLLPTPEQKMQEQQQAQQNPANQMQIAMLQEQLKNLQAQTKKLQQESEVEAHLKASELNLKEEEFRLKQQVDAANLAIADRKQTLAEIAVGVESQIAMKQAEMGNTKSLTAFNATDLVSTD